MGFAEFSLLVKLSLVASRSALTRDRRKMVARRNNKRCYEGLHKTGREKREDPSTYYGPVTDLRGRYTLARAVGA